MDQPGMSELLQNNQRSDYEQITIKAATHNQFDDQVLLKNFISIFGMANLDYNKIINEVRTKIILFFNKYLKNL